VVDENDALNSLEAVKFVVSESLFNKYIDISGLEVLNESIVVDMLTKLEW
jgi:hypothetical protein